MSQSLKPAEKESQIPTAKVDSSGQSGVLVFLGVLFTIILAGLDNTIVSTVMPVALPDLGGAHLYAWTFAAYMLAAAVSMPIWGRARIVGDADGRISSALSLSPSAADSAPSRAR